MAGPMTEQSHFSSVVTERGIDGFREIPFDTLFPESFPEISDDPVVIRRSFYSRWGKRSFDLVAALLLLTVVAIPMVIIGITIRLTTVGTVFYIQQRVGRHMRPFSCFKFRTMIRNAESILIENPQLQNAMAVSWKLHDDPRVTGIGRFLRQTSMDELPQLLNVIKGEMSLVGPRPVQPRELEEMYGDQGRWVTSVRPGMTGLWQVSGRSTLSYEERVYLDCCYVQSITLRGDLILLFRTIFAVLARDGAV